MGAGIEQARHNEYAGSIFWPSYGRGKDSFEYTFCMIIFGYLIIAAWVVLFVIWIVGAFTAKRTAWSFNGFGWIYRLGLIALVFLLIHIPIFDRWFHRVGSLRVPLVQTDPLWGIIGTLITLVGVGTAISARFSLGRNWGMPMTQRAEPELVTSGIYAYVRHPIYTGFILGMIGAAIGESIVWLIPLVVSAPYFLFSARREEKRMLDLFPDQYPAYRARTRRFIPWIF